jgi:TorA maturation chaperone TorD
MALEPEEQARADLYTLLGALLAAPPGQELIDLLRGIRPDGNTEKGVMTAAWRELSTVAQNVQPEPLREEFQRLFIGVGRGELLPYASWYLSGFLMDKPLAALRTDLARLGYALKEDVCEPEDHVASLCETMGAIISENSLSFEAQKTFYHSHLAPWMGRFFSDLAQAKSAVFYTAVGELGKQFMELEVQYYSMQH